MGCSLMFKLVNAVILCIVCVCDKNLTEEAWREKNPHTKQTRAVWERAKKTACVCLYSFCWVNVNQIKSKIENISFFFEVCSQEEKIIPITASAEVATTTTTTAKHAI